MDRKQQVQALHGARPVSEDGEETKAYVATVKMIKPFTHIAGILCMLVLGIWSAFQYISNIEHKVVVICDERFVSKLELEQRLAGIESSMASLAIDVKTMCALLRRSTDTGAKMNSSKLRDVYANKTKP